MSELATLPGLESVESAPRRDHLVSHGPEGRLMLFTGRSNPDLAQKIASEAAKSR